MEQVRAPTMTGLVRGLESSGLVSREVDPDDRRVAHIHATQRGREVLLRARDRRIEQLVAKMAALSDPELHTLQQAAEILERLSGR